MVEKYKTIYIYFIYINNFIYLTIAKFINK